MVKLKNSKCLKLISAMLIGSMLLAGCSKAEETTKKKKSKKSNTTSQAEETTTSEEEEPEESQGAADPNGKNGKSGKNGKGSTSAAGTYHLDTALWSADIPSTYQYDTTKAINTADENSYHFHSDANPNAYWVIYLIKEDASDFRDKYKTFFSMMDYANGSLPTRKIDGHDFVEFSYMNTSAERGMMETCYVYRHEAGSMTVLVAFGERGEPDDFTGWDLVNSIHFDLPDLGLSDPPFGFMSGEHRSEVKEQQLAQYKVTPVQCSFSEHVYITSEKGIYPFSSTATHVAASEKYLYTYSLRKELVTIYQINGEEMTKVAELSYTKSTNSATLPDNDTVTCIPDPDDAEKFILVETINGQEKVLSCLNEVKISPDGQTIVSHGVWADQVRLLHREPYAKTMTSSPLTLELDPSLEKPALRYFFFANNGIFVSLRGSEADATERLFEFDLNGKAVREIKDDAHEHLYVEEMYDFGDEILMDNYEFYAIELWNKEGKYISSVSIFDLIGISRDEVQFPHYSLVKTGDEGDFLLLFAYENDGILEDLIYRIHIG